MSWRPSRNVRALAAVSFFTDVSSEIIAPLLPLFLTSQLGASARLIGAIEGGADAVAALVKLGSGWWSDRLRRRKPLIVFGYALASIVRPLVAITTSAGQVLAIRLVDRVGKGIRGAPRDAMIAASTPAQERGRAFGFHRAADHAGAAVGPLLAWIALQWLDIPLRQLFWLAVIPGALAVLVAVLAVREPDPNAAESPVTPTLVVKSQQVASHASQPVAESLPMPFWWTLGAIVLFTLGNSTDAFLLLRASSLGVPVSQVPLLWLLLHVVKSATSQWGGARGDRVGHRQTIAAGWLLYAVLYAGFAFATSAWHGWALFAAYGVVFGLTEGTEKALVSSLVPAARRGAAFGWYHAAIGAAALPASLLFGSVWDAFGASTAFLVGSGLALFAVASLVAVGTSRN
ncbi:MAG: hypothetical protein RLZZ621_2065 [Gemmatimonadota bacterium]